MKLLVTGARGLLGSEFVAIGAGRGLVVVGLGREELDVTDADAVSETIAREAPDWVVHCAAYTAVDRAEEEPELAMQVNRDGAGNVAGAAADAGSGVVYISSDYVFDGAGERPYSLSDPVGPLSVYGRSKLAGEEAVLSGGADRTGSGDVGRESSGVRSAPVLVVRTGWLYGAGGRSFVQAILDRAEAGGALRVVEDQRGRPTWARNVAGAVLELIESGATGVWHVADGGDTTWLEFAREALHVRGLSVPVEGLSTAAWGAAAPRPKYSVLDVSGTEVRLGRRMMPWREALQRFLEEGRSEERSGDDHEGESG